MEYETGSSTAPANDLVLTVMNDGAVYGQRKNAACRILQGMDRAYLFRDMAELAAKRMRADMGSKFKARDVSEAAHRYTMGVHRRWCVLGGRAYGMCA